MPIRVAQHPIRLFWQNWSEVAFWRMNILNLKSKKSQKALTIYDVLRNMAYLWNPRTNYGNEEKTKSQRL
jgi:hypothetical protein